jgi:hypothetical protein
MGDSHVTERVISQFLTEIDGLEDLNDVTVIAASNRPDIIDPALLRPGRFDRSIYITPPDEEARLEIFKIHTEGKPLASDVDLEKLAKKTQDYTGADIAAICNEAVMLAIREYISSGGKMDKEELAKSQVRMKHFKKSMSKIEPIPASELQGFAKVSKRFRKSDNDDTRKHLGPDLFLPGRPPPRQLLLFSCPSICLDARGKAPDTHRATGKREDHGEPRHVHGANHDGDGGGTHGRGVAKPPLTCG